MPVPIHRITVNEYYRREAAGILAPGQRVELLEGLVVDMMPIGPFHSGVTGKLLNHFAPPSRGRWLVQCQNPLRIDERSEPVPDLMLLKSRPDGYTKAHPTPEDVLLLIEVADSSVAYDREDKLPLYARAGIAEYWIVNLVLQCIEIYREPHFTGYNFVEKVQRGGKALPLACLEAAVDVNELLGLT
jgi:Uma2 family endonuclease